MTIFHAILLGIIQGIAEFLPVSSSGHLILSQHLLGLQNLDELILFDLICHMGSLAAILFLFRTQLRIILLFDWTKIKQVIVGTLPLFFVAPFISVIHKFFGGVQYLGYFFIVNAFILYLGIRFGDAKRQVREKRPWFDPFFIGVGQLLAVFPGISRSGTTISSAKVLGWEPYEAVFFSFLLAIPAMSGATCYELVKETFQAAPVQHINITFIQYLAGFISSLLMGLFSLKILIDLAVKEKFIYFVWYSLFVGIISLIVT